jgi:hypothetical protein
VFQMQYQVWVRGGADGAWVMVGFADTDEAAVRLVSIHNPNNLRVPHEFKAIRVEVGVQGDATGAVTRAPYSR